MWPKLPHIVVIGGGYAGLPCALRLGRHSQSSNKAIARVTLINPEGKQELTSELYRALRTGDSALLPFTGLCKHAGVDFIEGQVIDIDPTSKKLKYRGPSSGEIAYDYAVIATGLKRKVPTVEGLETLLQRNSDSLNQNIFFFRNNHQATALRLNLNRMGFGEKSFRQNEKDFFTVILGAGSTGLEVAGELATLRGKNDRARIILLDEKESLLPDFSPIARKILKKELQRLQIESILGSPATHINQHEIHVKNGQIVPWNMLIICTGSRIPEKLFSAFHLTPGNPGLETHAHFEMKDFPDHFAIGDIAHAYRAHHALANKRYLPKTAQYAVQAGNEVADLLVNHLRHGEAFSSRTFHPKDLGYLVSLGPWSGVGRIGPSPGGQIAKYFSPFIVGPMVDELKRLANLKYRAQLEWNARVPF